MIWGYRSAEDRPKFCSFIMLLSTKTASCNYFKINEAELMKALDTDLYRMKRDHMLFLCTQRVEGWPSSVRESTNELLQCLHIK